MYIQIYIYIYPVYSDYILSMVGTSSIFTYTQTSYQVVSVKLSENVRFSMIIHTEVISIWNAHIYIYNIHMCVNTYVYVFTYIFFICIHIYIYVMIYICIFTHMYIYIYIHMYLYCYPILPTAEFVVFQCPEGQLIDLLSPGSCLVVASRGRPSHLEYI